MSVSQTQSGAYALVLAEETGDRRIPIIIGPVEAQAIAIQLEGLKPPRPLTHDLFKNIAVAFDINISEVIIYKLEEGIFFSELVCEMGTQEIRIDSRTSDAVALALRFKCPIYTTEEILRKAGIILDPESPSEVEFGRDIATTSSSKSESEFERYTVNELTDMMNESINNEDYERASRIRDEINRRKK
ncbi:bifunctional nuclease family protein [Mangrovibacterium lignilyticum]|uniref:bifunctional nuclease family protein n=1 Tax=Mangrovibacterium lignilyticum TaxID=2668052 RepID=UPI001EE5F302|nr:bifunctional nuclease family protein [Mangrovibacterium lignilyticum]